MSYTLRTCGHAYCELYSVTTTACTALPVLSSQDKANAARRRRPSSLYTTWHCFHGGRPSVIRRAVVYIATLTLPVERSRALGAYAALSRTFSTQSTK